ncbi:hypothetical protein [Streptomyces avermitilis]|uniref:hypothetical protein n=1 Tax=Streptomyces avermitilis TaxID=33903 RepID=UPI00372329A8
MRRHSRNRARVSTGPSRSTACVPEPREEATGLGEELDQDDDEDTAPVSRPAKELLRFFAPRDARQLAAFC